MAIELRQQLKLGQQLIMTPQLQMAIKLLQLNRLELLDTIQQELIDNPTLEEVSDTLSNDNTEEVATPTDDGSDIKEVEISEKLNDEIDWSNFIEEYNSTGSVIYDSEKKESTQYENFISQTKSLNDHLLWQLLMTLPSKREEEIGSLIIGNLNVDGYLEISIEEIAEMGDFSIEKVKQVLSLMQTFDPIGVCAQNLSQCLTIQAKHLNLDNTIVIDIIEKNLKHLENSNYSAISKSLEISINEVVTAAKIIKGLDPRPGRKFSSEASQYIVPDVYVFRQKDEFVIVLNDDGLPKLKISNYYKRAIKRKEKIDKNIKGYIQDKINSAAWLIKSIHQRQKTIYKVMESILKFQKEFFEHGVLKLRPMVLRDVAEDIGMHESTISRVTTNKYAYTPQGIFELKYFFSTSINKTQGGTIASASVQDNIKTIIEHEDPKKPLSDEAISEILAKENNIKLARRTVAKYRESMRILSSNKRKKF